jgi:hypothetical protein
MNHHRDRGLDNDFNDPSGWNRASYTADFLAELGEPLPEAPNGYRAAAIYHLQLMYAVDEFLTVAPDARVAVVAVAVVLGWPSIRGLTVPDIAGQLGCSPATLTRSIARFKTMAGLDSAGGVRFIRPGAGSSNGDKPAAVQSVGNIPENPALSHGDIDPGEIMIESFFDRLRLAEGRLRFFEVRIKRKLRQ